MHNPFDIHYEFIKLYLVNTDIEMDLIDISHSRLEPERQNGLNPECQLCALFFVFISNIL